MSGKKPPTTTATAAPAAPDPGNDTLRRLAINAYQATGGDFGAFERIIGNMEASRSMMMGRFLNRGRSETIREECGWPTRGGVSLEQYKEEFDHNGLAARIVGILPEECWKSDPEVNETDDVDEETPWEEKWKDIVEEHNLYSYMERVDVESRVGRFAVLLVGVDDGLPLSQPVGMSVAKAPNPSLIKVMPEPSKELNITYLRVFGEPQAKITKLDSDELSPRFGQPVEYSIDFTDPATFAGAVSATTVGTTNTKIVHWSRVVHVVDGKTSCEILGRPAQQRTWDRQLDITKIIGSDAQGFWTGAFPGLSIETTPESQGNVDVNDAKEQIDKYMNRLQRYLALDGLQANSLTTQVVDPIPHVDVQMDMISLSIGVPKRILLGSEVGELASTQDRETWDNRVLKRCNKHCTPAIVRPTVNLFMAIGVMPKLPKYVVEWPPRNEPSDDDAAGTAMKWMQALNFYSAGDADLVVPPKEALIEFFGMSKEKADAFAKAVDKHVAGEEADQARKIDAGLIPDPAPPLPPAGGPPGKPPTKGPTPPPKKGGAK